MLERRIRVNLRAQSLALFEGDTLVAEYPVSTAARGPGEQKNSEQTPRGRHRIRAKIGAGAPPGSVFVGRRPTGEICSASRFRAEPERDWILTRILWLSGLEPGRNRLGNVDSMQRYIYIHGTPDDAKLGIAASHGCIRMRNSDVIELFDRVDVGTVVETVEADDDFR